jgi:hypothetical protein
VVADLISRVKDGEPMDWRYDLGEDVYVLIKAPQLTIHIMKHYVPHGEWTLHPTKIGVTLSLYERKELKKTILYQIITKSLIYFDKCIVINLCT